jgi:hypothetical protein
MSHPATAGRTRTPAVVVRASSMYSLCSLPEWLHGVVLARVLTDELTRATGRPREQLPGTVLTVVAWLGAATDEELDLRDWRSGTGSAAALSRRGP